MKIDVENVISSRRIWGQVPEEQREPHGILTIKFISPASHLMRSTVSHHVRTNLPGFNASLQNCPKTIAPGRLFQPLCPAFLTIFLPLTLVIAFLAVLQTSLARQRPRASDYFAFVSSRNTFRLRCHLNSRKLSLIDELCTQDLTL